MGKIPALSEGVCPEDGREYGQNGELPQRRLVQDVPAIGSEQVHPIDGREYGQLSEEQLLPQSPSDGIRDS